jgi:uncharacterized protein YjbI with pentapeptide repeats
MGIKKDIPPRAPVLSSETSPEEKRMLVSRVSALPVDEDRVPYIPTAPVKPDTLAPDWIYENIQEVTVNCRKLFFIYLALLSYATLSALTTPVQNLFLGQDVRMPIINATIPLYYYLIVAPLLAIGFFIYNQLHLRKLDRLIEYAIDTCKSAHPDCDHSGLLYQQCTFNHICRHHENRFYPWIYIFSRYSRTKSVRKFQNAFILCSLWFFLPATLITFTFFVIKKHDHLLFYLMLSMTMTGIAVVFFFWNFHQQPKKTIRFILIEKSNQFVCFMAFATLFSLGLVCLHHMAREGRIWWVEGSVWKTDAGLHDRLLRSSIFVNLMDRQLVTENIDERGNSLILKKTHFEGANFSFSDLTKVNLRKSYLQNAELIHARLQDAELSDAILRGANLSGAKLKAAKFNRADLKHSDLVMADLTGADFTYANMPNSDLQHAILKDTIFLNANIRFADFRGAKYITSKQIKSAEDWQLAYFSEQLINELGLPTNHNENLSKRDLSGYNLSGIVFWDLDFAEFDFTDCDLKAVSFIPGTDLQKAYFKNAELDSANLVRANLSGANLANANLTKADLTGTTFYDADLTGIILDDAILQWADFRGAENLSVDKVKKANLHVLAYFDKEMIVELGLPSDHNIRLMSRNLSAYDFMHLDRLIKSLNFEFLPHHKLWMATYLTPHVVAGGHQPDFFGNHRDSWLKGANLANINLTGAYLQGADLAGVNFHSARLKKANFTGSNLKGVNFRGANLDGCILNHANLHWADFRSAKNLTRDQLVVARDYQLAIYSDALGASLALPPNHNDRLDRKFLYDYNLEEANLMDAVLNKADLRRANLKKANLTDAILSNANLEEAKLNEAILTKADLTDADLQYADLRNARGLTTKQLTDAANWKLAFFDDEWLSTLDLPFDHNERLYYRDFQNYHFFEAKLTKAKLTKANLKCADLRKADLEKATLRAANLKGADLTGANLQYADMSEVEGINKEQLTAAVKWKLAYYSHEWLAELDLPPNHNERLRIKNFKGYRFHGDSLTKVNFAQAQLDGADLSQTTMKDAVLADAVLCDTNLEGADLRGADLRGIRACPDQPPEADLFASVKTLYQARLDEPLQKQLKRAHPHLFSKPQGSGDGDN